MITSDTTSAAEGIFGSDLGMTPKADPIQQAPVTEPVQQPVQVQPPVQQDAPVTQPVVTEPKSDIIFEDEPAADAPVTFDENKYLTENYGLADKTVIKDRLAKFEQLQKDYEEAALKLAQPKYNNRVAEVLDEILKTTGGDITSNKEFVKTTLDLLTTDIATLDPMARIRFDMQIKYPGISKEQLDAHLTQTYMQGEEFSDEQKLAGSTKMLIDAKNADISIGDLKAKALTNNNDKQLALQQLQEEKRQAAWTEPAKKVVEGFKTIKLSLGKQGGKNAFLNFEVPADVAKGYEDVVYKQMVATGGLPNDQGLATAQNLMRALYINDNLDHITAHIASKLQSDSIKKEIAEYHNPNTTGNQSHQEVTKTISRDESIARSMGWKG